MTRIRITTGQVDLEAELDDNPTGSAIAAALPITAKANTWGDEIYFAIPVHLEEADDATAEMEVGDLAYWPAGDAFCLFFGPTPASQGINPRAASPVNRFGRLLGDPLALRRVRPGDPVRIERVDG